MARWKPSRTKAREFACKMKEIEEFCAAHAISMSCNGDSYYFNHGDKSYRVSNHTIEASNAGAFRDGIQVRGLYHDTKRNPNTVYIHAGKTRIIDIYTDIINGYELDGRGYRK